MNLAGARESAKGRLTVGEKEIVNSGGGKERKETVRWGEIERERWRQSERAGASSIVKAPRRPTA